MDTIQSDRWVCYYRCSTDRQGRSGLGLEAQKEAVANFLANQPGEKAIIAEFTEVESGKKSNRPMLAQALALCRKKKAVLVIAKLDRLARNLHFISGLLETGVEFVAADLATKSKFMIQLMASFAEEEGRVIGERTRLALARARARGVDIGKEGRVLAARHKREAHVRAFGYREVVTRFREAGFTTIRGMRDALNRDKIPSPGGGRWHTRNTFLLLRRLGLAG